METEANRADQSSSLEIDVFAHLRDTVSPQLLEFLDQAIVLFPEELRYRIKQVLDSLPAEGDNMHRILEVVRYQWKDIRSQHWVRIAITGPSQTGKSSLLQAMLHKQAPGARPIFTVVETPGLEEYLGYGSEAALPSGLAQADLILLVLDARYGISRLTGQTLTKLRKLGIPLLVALNKIDLAEDAHSAIREAKKSLGCSVFSTSVHRPGTLDKLLKAMVAANSKTLYPLAQSFPDFRRTLCSSIITQASFATGLVGVIPIPVSDLLPITAIQTAMLLKMARAFGCELDRQRARELLPMLLVGVLARQGGHRLRQRYPSQKQLVSVLVGGSSTYLMGRLAIRYFERTTGILGGSRVLDFEEGREQIAGTGTDV